MFLLQFVELIRRLPTAHFAMKHSTGLGRVGNDSDLRLFEKD